MDIDGKACNNIPEVVSKLAFQPAWAILVKLDEINMTPLIILNKLFCFLSKSFITGSNFSFIIYRYMIDLFIRELSDLISRNYTTCLILISKQVSSLQYKQINMYLN